MNPTYLAALIGGGVTIATFLGGIVGVLLRATWQLSQLVTRIERLEERQAMRDAKSDEIDGAIHDVETLKSTATEMRAEQRRQGAMITELRVVTGFGKTGTNGEFG